MTCPVEHRRAVRREIVERLRQVRVELATLASGARCAWESGAAHEIDSLADDLFWTERRLEVRDLEPPTISVLDVSAPQASKGGTNHAGLNVMAPTQPLDGLESPAEVLGPALADRWVFA